ncbi:MAG: tRNA (adenosine(37)-N6)-dimethylallyltransferase MiaA [Peptococcia bacterium]
MKKLLIIVGPTAVGKTAVSLDIAHKFKGEIISGDSMQVYRQMDIGTAKIKPEETQGIPHHLLDIRWPDETFNVAEFQTLARQKISEINQRGKIPILVGGTGLYVQAVIDEYKFGSVAVDYGYRKELQEIADAEGSAYLWQQLHLVDPEAADGIHPNDRRRIIRALEYFHTTNSKISANKNIDPQGSSARYQAVMIGLNMERQLLYQRIEDRVDKMMEEGFLEEVEKLMVQGYSGDLPSMQGLGYKQLVSYLEGEVDLETAISLIKRDTRRFAKRQLTWFRRDPRINWFMVDQYKDKQGLIEEIISFIGRTISVSVEI